MNYYPYFMNMPYYTNIPAKTGLLGIFKGIKFSSILNGTSKALNVANQAIPLIKQAKPVINNAKTIFHVMNEFKKIDNIPNAETKTINNKKTAMPNIKTKEIIKKQNDTFPTFFQ